MPIMRQQNHTALLQIHFERLSNLFSIADPAVAYSMGIDRASFIQRGSPVPHHMVMHPWLLTLVLCSVAAMSVEDDAFCCKKVPP